MIDPVGSDAGSPAPGSGPVVEDSSSRSLEHRLVDEGWRYVDGDDLAAAVLSFEKALSEYPRSAEAHYGLGYAKEMLGMSDQAFVHYCQAATYAPTGSEVWKEVLGRLGVLEG